MRVRTCPTRGRQTIFGFQRTSDENTSARPGGQFIILPYPAANELSGIYATNFARGVILAVKSRFDNSRPLVTDSTSFA